MLLDKKNIFFIFLTALSLYFLIQVFYFSANIKVGSTPDELFHIQLIDTYSQSSRFILNPAYLKADLGSISQGPFFYHWLSAQIGKLNIFNINQIVFLRFVNILLAAINLFFFYRLAGLIFSDKLMVWLSLALITNILMFVFISSGISYDNLVNLLATASLYYLFKYLQSDAIPYLLAWIIFAGLGNLTKISFLPLALLTFLILLICKKGNLKKIYCQFLNFFKQNSFWHYFIFGVSLTVIIFNLMFYGSNLIKYQKLTPACQDIYSHERCLAENRFYERNYFLKNSGRAIVNPSLHNYYFAWRQTIVNSTFGIQTHDILKPQGPGRHFANFAYLLFFALLLFLTPKAWKNKNIRYLLLISLAYILVVFFLVNYPFYKASGSATISLHGRYLFPVLAPLIMVFSYYSLNFVKQKTRIYLVIFFSLIIIYLGLPSFLLHPKKICFLKNQEFNNVVYDQKLGIEIIKCGQENL